MLTLESFLQYDIKCKMRSFLVASGCTQNLCKLDIYSVKDGGRTITSESAINSSFVWLLLLFAEELICCAHTCLKMKWEKKISEGEAHEWQVNSRGIRFAYLNNSQSRMWQYGISFDDFICMEILRNHLINRWVYGTDISSSNTWWNFNTFHHSIRASFGRAQFLTGLKVRNLILSSWCVLMHLNFQQNWLNSRILDFSEKSRLIWILQLTRV